MSLLVTKALSTYTFKAWRDSFVSCNNRVTLGSEDSWFRPQKPSPAPSDVEVLSEEWGGGDPWSSRAPGFSRLVVVFGSPNAASTATKHLSRTRRATPVPCFSPDATAPVQLAKDSRPKELFTDMPPLQFLPIRNRVPNATDYRCPLTVGLRDRRLDMVTHLP